jgi:hypothetical protein
MKKIKGISDRKFKELLQEGIGLVIEKATDPYHGAAWDAAWVATDVDPLDPGYEQVYEANFVEASGHMDEDDFGEWSFGWNLSKQQKSLIPKVGRALAKALTGTWEATADFAWERGTQAGYSRKKLSEGDTFHSEGDSFYRWGIKGTADVVSGIVIEENVPIEIKVKVRYVPSEFEDEEGHIVASAEFQSVA